MVTALNPAITSATQWFERTLDDLECEKMVIRRGDIFYAELRPVIGSEQGGVRPVLIIQNDTGNRHSPTVIVAAITSRMTKAKLPTHVKINKENCDICLLYTSKTSDNL